MYRTQDTKRHKDRQTDMLKRTRLTDRQIDKINKYPQMTDRDIDRIQDTKRQTDRQTDML